MAGMGRRVITKEYAETLLEGYRMTPGNASAAARHANCGRDTAARAWHKGIPHSPFPEYRSPFKDIVAREQQEARAMMEQQSEAAAHQAIDIEAERRAEVTKKAAEDSAKTRASEAAIIRASRGSVQGALAAISQATAGVAHLSAMVRKALGQLVVEDSTGAVCVVKDTIAFMEADPAQRREHIRPMSLVEARSFTTTLATLGGALRQVNDAAQRSMEMERLLLGEPTSITEHRHLTSVPVEEAQSRIEASARAMQRLKDKGIQVVDGETSTGEVLQ